MKNRKTIFTIIFALVLALSIVTVSAAAISANETKPDKSRETRGRRAGHDA